MHIFFALAWCFWGLALLGLLARLIARTIAQARALRRITSAASSELNFHEMRVLINRGDWRDPIERHQDSITAMTHLAGLAVAALTLTFVQLLAS